MAELTASLSEGDIHNFVKFHECSVESSPKLNRHGQFFCLILVELNSVDYNI